MLSSRLSTLVSRKRGGHELSSRELEDLCHALRKAKGPDTLLGAFLVSCDVSGLDANEILRWSRHLVAGEAEMEWPEREEEELSDHMISVINVGGICDVATIAMIPALTACGVKALLLDKSKGNGLSNPLGRLESIVGFDGDKNQRQIRKVINKVGCCIARCPCDLVPTEGALHNYMCDTGTAKNVDLMAVCLLAEAASHNCSTVLFNIQYGANSSVRTKEEGDILARNLRAVSPAMGFKPVVHVVQQVNTVSQSVGGVPEVSEILQCLCGEGSEDQISRACGLGGLALSGLWPGVAEDAAAAQVKSAMTDGRGRHKLEALLHAQGVSRSDVRALFRHRKEELSPVLPISMFRTHLAVQSAGTITGIYLETVANVVSSLQVEARAVRGETNHSLGLEILLKPGASVTKGSQWGRLHHDTRLSPAQLSHLSAAIIIQEVEQTSFTTTAEVITNGTKGSNPPNSIDAHIENQKVSFEKSLKSLETKREYHTCMSEESSSNSSGDIKERLSDLNISEQPSSSEYIESAI